MELLVDTQRGPLLGLVGKVDPPRIADHPMLRSARSKSARSVQDTRLREPRVATGARPAPTAPARASGASSSVIRPPRCRAHLRYRCKRGAPMARLACLGTLAV